LMVIIELKNLSRKAMRVLFPIDMLPLTASSAAPNPPWL
jgi:hypothetical protein